MLSALCHQVVINVSQLSYGTMLRISDKSSRGESRIIEFGFEFEFELDFELDFELESELYYYKNTKSKIFRYIFY